MYSSVTRRDISARRFSVQSVDFAFALPVPVPVSFNGFAFALFVSADSPKFFTSLVVSLELRRIASPSNVYASSFAARADDINY